MSNPVEAIQAYAVLGCVLCFILGFLTGIYVEGGGFNV